jgi:hypothetical protein
MANVRSEVSGPGEPDLSVEVRPVHIDLPAVLVHDATNLPYPFFENAVRRGVGDHERRQSLSVRFRLRFEIAEIDVSAFVAGHGNDP